MDIQKMMDVQAARDRYKHFKCAIDGKPLDVYRFTAEESIFANFRVDVTVVSDWKPNVADYLGKNAVLTLTGKKTSMKDRIFQGTITSVEEGRSKGRFYLFKIIISPCLWNLPMIRDVRIFQNMTTPDIIKEVLKTSDVYSFEYECRFHGDYSKREYCVQYRETNMDFITRLMAEEGMFFYYEIKKDTHFLVFGDSYHCHKDISGNPAVLFSEKGQLVDNEEVVTVFNDTNQITTGAIQLRDYDFTHPSYKPVASAQSTEYDGFENYDYPGNLVDEKTGNRLATMNLERETRKRHTMTGKSICRNFSAGHTFTLTGQHSLNSKVEYLLTKVTHHGKQPQALQELADSTKGNSYSNTFTCTPSPVPFRPDRPGPKPSVTGVQTAIVTGPKDEEIYTDEYGRIKVQFHWDRLGKNNGLSSCWIRVAQSWAGAGWGSMFIPRIGQEVIVDFIDGDPDRPIVTGAVYNGRNMPPYSLPDEKTKSTIKTETTKGGGGFNELRFEDKKDKEEIYIHGQKDWNIEILNDKGQSIGHDEKLDVKNDRTKTVGVNQSESIGVNKTIHVGANHTETIGATMNLTVSGLKNEIVALASTENVGGAKTVTVGAAYAVTVAAAMNTAVGLGQIEEVGLTKQVHVGKNLVISVADNVTITCGKSQISMDKNGNVSISGSKLKLIGSDHVEINGEVVDIN